LFSFLVPQHLIKPSLILESQGSVVNSHAFVLEWSEVVNTFKNYFKHAELNFKDYVNMKDDFELEYSLSKLFSNKQKELFMKKLKGEKMTKTEREYFSRSVKKKLLALANSDLYKLATKLVKE